MSTVAQTTFTYFAVCAPGLESLLAQELAGLGISGQPQHGGVEGRVGFEQLWQLHLRSNLAESVRVRLKAFDARSFSELEARLAKLPWHAYFAPGSPIEVRVSCHHSKLYHSDAVRVRVARVIRARLERQPQPRKAPSNPSSAMGGEAPGSAAPAAEAYPGLVHVRIDRDRVVASVEASGERLHKRGQRTIVRKAPLRETLAAALIHVLDAELGPAGLGATQRLWDPFCGSGVIVLEAARIWAGRAPGSQREFAFEHWPSLPRQAWERFRAEQAPPKAVRRLEAWGSDVAVRAMRAAKGNAAAFDTVADDMAAVDTVADDLGARPVWLRGDFRTVAAQIPLGTAIVSNPPYGKRVGADGGLTKLYRDFEALLETRGDLRPVVIACGYQPFQQRQRLAWQRVHRTRHGGLAIDFMLLR